MPDRPQLFPILSAMLACILGGSAIVATRFVVGETDPLALAVLRYGGAAVVMLLIAAATLRGGLRMRQPGLAQVLVLGVLQFGVFGWLFTASLAYAPAARAALILSTQPIFTLVLAGILGRERMTPPKIVGAAVGLGGVALALGDNALAVGPEVWKGDALMFGATLVGAVYNVFTGPLSRRFPALAMTAIQLPVGALALFVVLAMTGDLSGLTSFSAQGWAAVLYIITFAGAVTFYAWVWALERIAPSRVAIMVTLNPIAAALLAAPVLGEPLTWRVIAGLVCVVAGIGLANWPLRRAAQATPTA
jgi:drug/metabolite transporter (DMT)-like permease